MQWSGCFFIFLGVNGLVVFVLSNLMYSVYLSFNYGQTCKLRRFLIWFKQGGVLSIVILMGVSGSGKTTIGQRLAAELNWPFYDGDDFHPQQNIDKMHSGHALSDDDRAEWLLRLQQLLLSLASRSQSAVLACSALKHRHRDQLSVNSSIVFVYLKAVPDLTRQRLRLREAHFMTDGLLQSQFDALEEPADVLTLDNRESPQIIVERIKQSLNLY